MAVDAAASAGVVGPSRAFAGEDPGSSVDRPPSEQFGGEADFGDLVLARRR